MSQRSDALSQGSRLFRAHFSARRRTVRFTFALQRDLFAQETAERYAARVLLPLARRLEPDCYLAAVVPQHG